MLKSKAIANFLNSFSPKTKDLYYKGMEVQVIGNNTPFRLLSTHGDNELKFDLKEDADKIGVTGYNYETQVTEWIGLDIDGDNHDGGNSDETITNVINAAKFLKYLTLRHSGSGKGLHIYIKINQKAESPNEHRQIARQVNTEVIAELRKICPQIPEKLTDKIGQVLWIWSRRGSENRYDIIQEATEDYSKKNVVSTIINLPRSIMKYPLSEAHTTIVEWLEGNTNFKFNHEKNFIHSHTSNLIDCFKELNLPGYFVTDSPGTDLTSPNCFLIPLKDCFKVVSFRGTENPFWIHPTDEKPYCFFGRSLNASEAMRAIKAVNVHTKRYEIKHLHLLCQALGYMGIKFELNNEQASMRPAIFLIQDEDKFEITIDAIVGDKIDLLNNFTLDKSRNKFVCNINCNSTIEHADQFFLRALISECNEPMGYAHRTNDNFWVNCNLAEIRGLIAGCPATKEEKQTLYYDIKTNPWTVTFKPFEVEYPTNNRIWNRSDVRYATSPEPGDHPQWDSLIQHLAKNIEDEVRDDKWCHANNVNAFEYIFLYLAIALQTPEKRLPYLFLYSSENETGKSMLIEGIQMLITRSGWCDGYRSLIENHNSALEQAIFCFIHEHSLQGKKGSIEKLKTYVTESQLSIRSMRTDEYTVVNHTHWIHTSNNIDACPISENDTRVTVIHVTPYTGTNVVTKEEAMKNLRREVPYILHSLLTKKIPPPSTRLALPALASAQKTTLQHEFISSHHVFFKSQLRPGTETIAINDLYNRYAQWCVNELRDTTSQKTFISDLRKTLKYKITNQKIHGVEVHA